MAFSSTFATASKQQPLSSLLHCACLPGSRILCTEPVLLCPPYNIGLLPYPAPFHGVGGPLTVSNKQWGSPVMKAYLEAGKELGYPTIDNNAAHQIGLNKYLKSLITAFFSEIHFKPLATRLD